MNIWGLKKKIERIKFAIKREMQKPRDEYNPQKIKILMGKKAKIKEEIKEIKKLREKKKGK